MDYISKPALMGKLTCAEEQKKIKAMTGEEAYNEFLVLVNGMEKADVAPVRRGRWVFDTGDVYMCTCCNDKCHVKEVMEEPVFRFCPNCGARMDGGADNDTD